MSIYGEILIGAPMHRLWEHTQTPKLHEQWTLSLFEKLDSIPERVLDVCVIDTV